MEEFNINSFINLKLVDGKTIIYISGKKFIQCKFLLLNIPLQQMESTDSIKSIDEAADKLNFQLEYERSPDVPPELEFWGHCSNLQVWAENGYDSKFLHRNLAFPLLKQLSDEGDYNALKIFKEEIAKRLIEGNLNVFEYLSKEGYLEYLHKEEFLSILANFEQITVKLLKKSIIKEFKSAIEECRRCFELPFLDNLKKISIEKYKKLLMGFLEDFSLQICYYLIDMKFLELIPNRELNSILTSKNENFIEILNRLVNLTNYKCNTAIALFFERLEDLSTSDRELILRSVLKFANPELLCYLQYIETYTKSFQIPRNIYYSFILEKDEAEIMIKLEKSAGKHFKIREILDGEAGELIFTIKDRHIQGILISGQDTIPEEEKTKIFDLICNLKNLKILDLCYLNLTSLPSKVENLKNLEVLNLQGNKLMLIPNSILNLNKLRIINVNENLLKKK